MKIVNASVVHVDAITRLIMTAMTDDCCRNLAGPRHTLDDFRRVMRSLVMMEHSQYSYLNAMVALDDEAEGFDAASRDIIYAPVAGVIVGYDGSELHRLRRQFQEAALQHFQMDYTNMDDETRAGEFYIDSLAVDPAYRRRGIARSLLAAMAERARSMGLPAALLVDKGNPSAERLYRSVGFRHVGDAVWGGHEMRRMLCGGEGDGVSDTTARP